MQGSLLDLSHCCKNVALVNPGSLLKCRIRAEAKSLGSPRLILQSALPRKTSKHNCMKSVP